MSFCRALSAVLGCEDCCIRNLEVRDVEKFRIFRVLSLIVSSCTFELTRAFQLKSAYWTRTYPEPKYRCSISLLLNIFTARHNARIASAVLATAIPSVCPSVRPSVRPSVTRRYCINTFALSDSKMCLVLYKLKIFPRDDPSP